MQPEIFSKIYQLFNYQISMDKCHAIVMGASAWQLKPVTAKTDQTRQMPRPLYWQLKPIELPIELPM